MKVIKIKASNLDSAFKKIKKKIKEDQKKTIKEEMETELDELCSADEYKKLRKYTRKALKEFKALPYKDQVDSFMDLQTLSSAFKSIVEDVKKEHDSIDMDKALDDLVDAISGKNVEMEKYKKFTDDPVRKKVMKCVKMAIAIKKHQKKVNKIIED